VLSHTDAPENPCCGLEGSELMLVDFGRAVDLTKLSDNDTKLHGYATGPDMRCVAMRAGRSWSFDVDTYGILCSAHILLFGTHMQIEKSGDNQWQPVCKFRRYWQKDLWAETFESLLNLDEVSASAIGSRPRSLRLLRGKIESYLEGESSNLRSALIRQATLLPANREQLG
jgi:checkpoint serine/threonine-protein kinase